MECPGCAMTKPMAARGSIRVRVRVIRIQNKVAVVAVVAKVTLEGMRVVEKAGKEKRCHLSKVRRLHWVPVL